ncbi:MAG: nucleotidyltransferase family protein [Nitrospirae bacterium]|nr:nucleotidyltransferase family protein [Candidatus Troglogloeales bacterium]
MNAIILAGDRKSALPLHGMNKAFLLLEGWPIFIHVLTALNQSKSIETIYIIGHRKAIIEGIEKALPVFLFTKNIEVLEQKESLIQNIVYAYGHASRSQDPVLFLPADIPLVTSEEIDAFISMSDMNQYDYCLGVTSSEHLKRFYPKLNEPGIKMPYLYLKDNVYRMNNLHIARLSCQTAGSIIQTIYNHRRQNSIWNRIKMVLALLKADHGRSLLLSYLLAQCAVLLSRFGLHRIATLFRKPLSLDRVEKEFSSLLQMRFKAVETNMGGAALDIDDESAYETITLAFKKWHETLMPRQTEHGHEAACPFQAKRYEMGGPAAVG